MAHKECIMVMVIYGRHKLADGTEKRWDEAGNLIFETTVGNLK